MSVRTILYLRQNEMAMFQKLNASLRKKWSDKIVEETGTDFETREELDLRVARYAKNPTLAKYLSEASGRLAAGEDCGRVLGSMPEKAMRVFLDAIGASGMCALIEMALLSGRMDDAAMQGIVHLSAMRHQQLLHKTVLA